MFATSPVVPRTLVAATAAILLISTASIGEAAGWPFTFGKPPAEKSDSIQLAQADADRMGRIEAQMRTLTGQIEELTHQLQVLQDQLKRMQDDTEYRFSELQGVGAAPGAGAQTPAAPPAPLAKSAVQTPADEAVAASQAPADATGLGAPPKPLGQISLDAPVLDAPPAGAQPLDLSTLAGDATGDQPAAAGNSGNAQVASIAPTGDPSADYNRAYGLVTAGRYDVAETALRQFLETYPSDALAPDAEYWLGRTLFARGNYADSAKAFQTGYTKYPKGRFAPDSLVMLGVSLGGLSYRDEACKMYALALKQYPQMSPGLRSRVKAEQASASC